MSQQSSHTSPSTLEQSRSPAEPASCEASCGPKHPPTQLRPECQQRWTHRPTDPQTRCPQDPTMVSTLGPLTMICPTGVEPAVGQHPTRQLHKRTGRAHRAVLRTRGPPGPGRGPAPGTHPHRAALRDSAPGGANAGSGLRPRCHDRGEQLVRRCAGDGAAADPRAAGVCSEQGVSLRGPCSGWKVPTPRDCTHAHPTKVPAATLWSCTPTHCQGTAASVAQKQPMWCTS